LPFTGIVSTVAAVVEEHVDSGWVSGESISLKDVLAADAWARERVSVLLASG
jgi:1-deoxy-D-xylulose-5-phosphate reductoisomerase